MAFSNTYDTTSPGSGVSNREDLTDVLTILAPEETPILSSAQKQKASATFVEWTVDSLSAPVTTGIREGADVGDGNFDDKFAGRARLGNYIQKFRRDYQVSDLQEAVDSVGPAKIAQAEAKSIRELKRDIEATIASANDRAVENGTDTAYALRGLGEWLSSSGPADVPAGFRTPADSVYTVAEANATAFGETQFNDIIASIFNQTGTVSDLMLVADTKLRRVISDFARTTGSATDNVRSQTYC
jgi:hypothetical protein